MRQREQFGRAIGSFQAVKHRLADVYVRVQAARSAAMTPPGRRARVTSGSAGSRSPRGWRRCVRPPPRRSSCTAASASPGSTRPSCTSSARPATYLLFGPVHRLRAYVVRRGAALRRRGGGGLDGARDPVATRRAECAEGVLDAGLRPDRPAPRPRHGPRGAPADARQGAAQRAAAAGDRADGAGRPQWAGAAYTTGLYAGGGGRLDFLSGPTSGVPIIRLDRQPLRPSGRRLYQLAGRGHPGEGPSAGGGGSGTRRGRRCWRSGRRTPRTRRGSTGRSGCFASCAAAHSDRRQSTSGLPPA